MSRKLLAGSMLLATAMNAPLFAQARPGTDVAPPASSEADSILTEVVITAERRSVNVQKAPIAVTALGTDDLLKRGIRNLDDLENNTPGLVVNNAGPIKLFNIRGIGLTLVSPVTSSGVTNYRDGVLVFHEPTLVDPIYDLARIEVLRGPQGTLTGSNSTGGAVLTVSQQPKLGETGGFVQQTIGNYSDVKTEAALNMPAGDTLAFRVATIVESRDSYSDNLNPNTSNKPGNLNQQGARLSTLFKPGENFTALFRSEYNRTTSDGGASQPTPYSLVYNTPGTPHEPFKLNYDVIGSTTVESWRNVLQLDYQLVPSAALRSISTYSRYHVLNLGDTDASPAPVGSQRGFGPRIGTLSQEFNLISTGSSPLQYVLGAYFLRDSLDDDQLIAPVGRIVDHQVATDYAGFGQVTYDITPTLQLLGAYRYTQNRRDIDNFQFPFPYSFSSDDGVSTGKAGVNFTPNDDNLIFAFAARGAKAGGYNSSGVPFGPEQVWDYEIGWKSTLLERRVRTQLGIFYNDYSDFQLSNYNDVRRQNEVQNTKGATIKGLEAQIQAQFGALGLDASLSYIDSSFDDESIIDGRFAPPPGSPLPAPPAVDVGGNRMPFAPKRTANAGIDYRIGLGADGGTLTPRAQVSYIDSQWVTVYNIPGRDYIPSRVVIDLRLTYRPTPAWMVEGYAQNVADKAYISYISASGTTPTLTYAAPRTFGIRGSYAF